MVDEYKDRLKEAMADKKMSRQQLADALGISYQAVRKVLIGESGGFELENHNAACRVLGVCSDWLLSGKLPKLADSSNVVPADPGTQRIPFLDYVQAGKMTAAASQRIAAEADEFLLTTNEVSSSAFALRIKGDSMEPEFKSGDVVVIDIRLAPLPGDFVVAKNGDHEATFKKYRPRGLDPSGKEVFELIPLNEDYAPIRSDQQPIAIIGTMVEHRKYRRR